MSEVDESYGSSDDGLTKLHRDIESFDHMDELRARLGAEQGSNHSERLFGDYSLARVIGRGSFGTVWLAQNIHDFEYCAVKILHPGKEMDLGGIRAFRRCAGQSPHLIPIRHVGQQQGSIYYVMDLADNANAQTPVSSPEQYQPLTLAEFLNREKKIDWVALQPVLDNLLSGLTDLHQAGLVHRDVKPSNIVSLGNKWVLGDPGLICSIGSNTHEAGSTAYCPPEGNKSPSADLYALCKTIWVCVSGKKATEPMGDWDNTTCQPLALAAVLSQGTHQDPTKRFSSCEEMRAAYRRATPPSTGMPFARWVVAAAVIVAFGVLAIVARPKQSVTPDSNEVNVGTQDLEPSTSTRTLVLHPRAIEPKRDWVKRLGINAYDWAKIYFDIPTEAKREIRAQLRLQYLSGEFGDEAQFRVNGICLGRRKIIDGNHFVVFDVSDWIATKRGILGDAPNVAETPNVLSIAPTKSYEVSFELKSNLEKYTTFEPELIDEATLTQPSSPILEIEWIPND